MPSTRLAALCLAILIAAPAGAFAQAAAPTPAAAPDPAVAAAVRQAAVAEADFTSVNLPTTLRLARHRSAFRVTHRFARSVVDGGFGDTVGSLFGLDNGAQIGLEYRFGVTTNLQAGIYRTSDKTIEFFGQYSVLLQPAGAPVSLAVVSSIEGLNNFHKGTLVDAEDNEYTTAIGFVASRTVGSRAAFYVQPSYLVHANVYSTAGCLEHLEHGHQIPGCDGVETTGIESNSLLLGLSARVRLGTRSYVVGSWTPRVDGFGPGTALKTFGIEERLGGHVFQLNFSNSLASTMAQTARGASNNNDWFMGVNISRRF